MAILIDCRKSGGDFLRGVLVGRRTENKVLLQEKPGAGGPPVP